MSSSAPAISARQHAPLLPLYKSSFINAELSSNLGLWVPKKTGSTFKKAYEAQGVEQSEKENSPRSNHAQAIRLSRQPQETSLPRQTSMRSRLRVSPLQHVFHCNPSPRTSPTTISSPRNLLKESKTPSTPSLTSSPCACLLLAPQISIANLMDSRSFWLALYFFFNLCLTLHNKMVLMQFPFPYTLTALHALSSSIGGYLLLERGAFVSASLNPSGVLVLAAFSILYSVNIIVSNVSLQLVTVPFHQVLRAATPIFTILFTAFILGIPSSRARMTSLVPVIAGVGLATYGDYDFTPCGFFLTLLGTILAALKTVLTNALQSPRSSSDSQFHRLIPHLHLRPLDLLFHMSPFAFVQCLLFAQISGELQRVQHFTACEMTPAKAALLLVNGAVAFGLNVVSFTANKKAGAVSMTVAANVKQVLTISLAVSLFNLTITWTNGLGIILTLLGGAWYAMVEHQEKRTDGSQ